MIDALIRHCSRPLPKRPITKRTAIVLTFVGLFTIVLGLVMLFGEWGDLPWRARTFWTMGMIVSLWMLPWTWANFFGDRK